MNNFSVKFLFLLPNLFLAFSALAQEKQITLQAGDVITQSVSVKKGVYYLDGRDSLLPAMIIDGNNITIDLYFCLFKFCFNSANEF